MLRFPLALTLVTSIAATPAKADSTDLYMIASVASYHIHATGRFNQLNPGLSFGISKSVREQTSWEYGGEIGYYRNSYKEITRYVLASTDFRLAKTSSSSELRIGAFLGFFEYPNVVGYAEDYGIPTVGNFIAVPGIAAIIRFDSGHDVRIKLTPGGSKSTAILAIQFAKSF